MTPSERPNDPIAQSVPTIDPRALRMGVSKLRTINAEWLNQFVVNDEIAVLQMGDEPLAVLVPYAMYLQMQSRLSALVSPEAVPQTVEAIASFVEHLRDDYFSKAEPVSKVARLIREKFGAFEDAGQQLSPTEAAAFLQGLDDVKHGRVRRLDEIDAEAAGQKENHWQPRPPSQTVEPRLTAEQAETVEKACGIVTGHAAAIQREYGVLTDQMLLDSIEIVCKLALESVEAVRLSVLQPKEQKEQKPFARLGPASAIAPANLPHAAETEAAEHIGRTPEWRESAFAGHAIAFQLDEEGDVLACVPDFSGCMTHGRTLAEAFTSLLEVAPIWMQQVQIAGVPIPQPTELFNIQKIVTRGGSVSVVEGEASGGPGRSAAPKSRELISGT